MVTMGVVMGGLFITSILGGITSSGLGAAKSQCSLNEQAKELDGKTVEYAAGMNKLIETKQLECNMIYEQMEQLNTPIIESIDQLKKAKAEFKAKFIMVQLSLLFAVIGIAVVLAMKRFKLL